MLTTSNFMTPREVVTIVTVGNQGFDANQKNHEYIHMILNQDDNIDEHKHNINTKYVLLMDANSKLNDDDMVGKLHDHDEDIVISGDNIIVKNNIFQKHAFENNSYSFPMEVDRLVNQENGYTVVHI